MRLREHHCISPAIPALAGHNPNDAIDDGIRNGWFPSVEIRESGVRCLHAYTQLSLCTDSFYAAGQGDDPRPFRGRDLGI